MSVVRSSSKLSQTVAPASFWKFNVNNNCLCGNTIDRLIFRYIFGAIFLKTYFTDYVSTFHFITVRAGISVLTLTGVLCCVVSVMARGRVLTGGTCAGWSQNTKRNFSRSLLFVELSYRKHIEMHPINIYHDVFFRNGITFPNFSVILEI